MSVNLLTKSLLISFRSTARLVMRTCSRGRFRHGQSARQSTWAYPDGPSRDSVARVSAAAPCDYITRGKPWPLSKAAVSHLVYADH